MPKKPAPETEALEVAAPELPALVRIDRPGYYDMDIRSYIADPCPDPSLSKGVVHDLHYRTMNRAAYRHPRIGGGESPDATRADIGTAIHVGVSGGREIVYAPAEFQNWMKDAAKAFRDNAYAHWQVPLLEKQRGFVNDTVGRVKQVLAAEFDPVVYERTLCWKFALTEGCTENGDVWCRAREDAGNDRVDIDFKSATNANPVEWGKFTMTRGGYDIQAAMRDDGHKALGYTKELWWLVIEFEPPYDHGVYRVAESIIEAGREKVKRAAPRWRAGLDTGKWPSYGRDVIQASSRVTWELEEYGGVQ